MDGSPTSRGSFPGRRRDGRATRRASSPWPVDLRADRYVTIEERQGRDRRRCEMMRAPSREPIMTTVPPVDLERRHITALAALTLLGGATITITGCGGGGGSSPAAAPAPPAATPPAAASCPSGSACGQVDGDPAHRAEITAAQLSAGGALELDIKGSSVHSHTGSLTADEWWRSGTGLASRRSRPRRSTTTTAWCSTRRARCRAGARARTGRVSSSRRPGPRSSPARPPRPCARPR